MFEMNLLFLNIREARNTFPFQSIPFMIEKIYFTAQVYSIFNMTIKRKSYVRLISATLS